LLLEHLRQPVDGGPRVAERLRRAGGGGGIGLMIVTRVLRSHPSQSLASPHNVIPGRHGKLGMASRPRAREHLRAAEQGGGLEEGLRRGEA
jgi:hypothetical protein